MHFSLHICRVRKTVHYTYYNIFSSKKLWNAEKLTKNDEIALRANNDYDIWWQFRFFSTPKEKHFVQKIWQLNSLSSVLTIECMCIHKNVQFWHFCFMLTEHTYVESMKRNYLLAVLVKKSMWWERKFCSIFPTSTKYLAD